MRVKDLLQLQQAQLRAVVELRGVRRMRKIYAESQAEIADRLRALEKAGRGKTFQAHHMRQVLLQVYDGVQAFEGKLDHHLASTGRLASTLAPRHLTSMVKKLDQHFTGTAPVLQVEKAAVFQRMLRDVDPSLLDRFKKSTKLYGAPVVKKIRDELSMSIVQNQTVDEAVDRVVGTSGIFDGQRWRAERIVRTEMSYAYNVTAFKTLQETARQDEPGLLKKLIEVVPSDGRTGEDSLRLHGQVQPIDKPFVYKPPPGEKGYPPFMMPPGRPNDRAVVIPWRPGWPETAATEPL